MQIYNAHDCCHGDAASAPVVDYPMYERAGTDDALPLIMDKMGLVGVMLAVGCIVISRLSDTREKPRAIRNDEIKTRPWTFSAQLAPWFVVTAVIIRKLTVDRGVNQSHRLTVGRIPDIFQEAPLSLSVQNQWSSGV